LLGNHELHYFDEKYKASRFSWEYYDRYSGILDFSIKKGTFQLCKQIDNYLFIHAGVLKTWYDLHKDEFLNLGNTLEKQLNNYFVMNKDAFFEISYFRLGLHQCGSPLWADIREFDDEEIPFDENIIQIIGHTQLYTTKPFNVKNVWCLDNRQMHKIELSTGKFN
jgi:hypothetical protein